MNITKLHAKAKRAIAAGEHKLREAAECLADAKKLGATQRASAKAIGKSPAWVNQLLAWRESGYKGGAFERSHKSRYKSRAFSPAKQPRSPRQPVTKEEALARTAEAESTIQKAKTYAAMFAPDVKRIPAATRAELIAALKMLAKSRDTAAMLVERQRARLNLDWSDLLLPAEQEHENDSPARVAHAA